MKISFYTEDFTADITNPTVRHIGDLYTNNKVREAIDCGEMKVAMEYINANPGKGRGHYNGIRISVGIDDNTELESAAYGDVGSYADAIDGLNEMHPDGVKTPGVWRDA